jgi:hypothetical protein
MTHVLPPLADCVRTRSRAWATDSGPWARWRRLSTSTSKLLAPPPSRKQPAREHLPQRCIEQSDCARFHRADVAARGGLLSKFSRVELHRRRACRSFRATPPLRRRPAGCSTSTPELFRASGCDRRLPHRAADPPARARLVAEPDRALHLDRSTQSAGPERLPQPPGADRPTDHVRRALPDDRPPVRLDLHP